MIITLSEHALAYLHYQPQDFSLATCRHGDGGMHRLLGVIPNAMLQDCLLWSRVLPSPAASPSLDTYLPPMSEFCAEIHSWMCHVKPTFVVYISLLLAETLCRLSRRLSPSTPSFSSLMRCWYVTWKKRTRSCSALMSAIQIHRAVCTSHSQCVCSGILVGCGMQKIAALSNLVAYYCIALPVGAALMFAAHLKILGNGLQHSISLLHCSWIWALEKPVLNTDTSTISTCFWVRKSAVGVAESRKRREDVASLQRTLADYRRTQISRKPFDSSNVMLSC